MLSNWLCTGRCRYSHTRCLCAVGCKIPVWQDASTTAGKDVTSTDGTITGTAASAALVAMDLEVDESKLEDIPAAALTPGTDLAIFLNPIYFDLDKSFIRSDSCRELNKVVSIMNQYPTLEIDVRSHTDSRASDAYNMALSERRNRSTIQYLVDKGISRSRLTGRGYGETQLVNHCSNGVQCPDEVHEQNRRSEFIITKR